MSCDFKLIFYLSEINIYPTHVFHQKSVFILRLINFPTVIITRSSKYTNSSPLVVALVQEWYKVFIMALFIVAMNTAPLMSLLSDITALSPSFHAAITGHLKEEHYRAHQILHAAGQVERRLWFLENGFARAYYFDQTGKEHTLSFFKEKEIIFSYRGYWKEPTDYYAEVLTDSALLSLDYEVLSSLMEQFEETRVIVQSFIRQRYHQEDFKCRLLTWSAEDRYHQFRKTSPDIFRLASVRLIASYLNMTRENLSRLMGREH